MAIKAWSNHHISSCPATMADTYFSAQKLEIEAIQSVSPSKVSDPQAIRRVLVADPNVLGVLQGCLSLVLYYHKDTQKDLGFIVAAWIRESLGRALIDQPLLGGRLYRGQDGSRELEIVPNDSGVRLVEAKIPVTLQEFLVSKGKNKPEPELVFWEDVDEQNLRSYPLLYVQVTNFRCGGYSIGISCSLLVADLLIMDNFLSKWVDIHSDMMSSENDSVIQEPIFFHPKLKPSTFTPNVIRSTASRLSTSKAMIFKIVDEEGIRSWDHESCKILASLCTEETETRLGGQMPSEFYSVIINRSEKLTKVEVYKKDEGIGESPFNLKKIGVRFSLWDELGLKELAFQKGNKPAHTSFWIGSRPGGLMIVIPSMEQDTPGMSMIVSVP